MPHHYTFKYKLNNEIKKVNNLEGKITLDNWVTDSTNHLVLKLLSYFMFYNPEIKIDVKTDHHFRSDLIVEGNYNQPKLWIECGSINIKKLNKVATKCHNCEIYVIKNDENSLKGYVKEARKRISHVERISFIAFEKGYIDKISEIILNSNERTIDVICKIKPENIETIFNNGHKIESRIFRLN